MRNPVSSLVRTAICVALIASFLLYPGAAPVARAQEPQGDASPALTVTLAPGQTQVRWLAPSPEVEPASASVHLPLHPYGRYLLPMQTIAVRADNDVLPAAATSHLVDTAWTGQPEMAGEMSPPALDWEPVPWVQPADDRPLPNAPLLLLSEGRMRGTHIAVYAFSEIYQDASGALRQVVEFDAVIPGSRPIDDVNTLLPSGGPSVAASQVQSALAGAVAPPTNDLAGRRAVKVFISQAGIQHINAGELAAAGLSGPDAGKLRLFYRGAEVALQVFDSNKDGKLEGGSESIRFYAPAPGDVWNREDIYWLIEASASGLRMASRSVAPQQATRRDTALETGVWTLNKLYESTVPGADGDNWFHLEGILTPATTNASAPSFQANLSVRLPLAENAPEKSVFTLAATVAGASGSGQVPHRLKLSGGSVAYTDGDSDWPVDPLEGAVQNFSRRIETGGRTAALTVKLLPNAHSSAVFFDQITWQQPVRLSLGGKGAAFRGIAGTWRYQVSGAPSDARLYDITDPLKPQILAATPGVATAIQLYVPLVSAGPRVGPARPSVTELVFQDGPDPRDYLIAGDGTLHTPRLEVHSAVSFSGGADAVYIAPQLFHEALQPLVYQRSKQGYKSQVVDVQAIYDAWSYGSVDPAAIRSFLRYAAGTWSPSPISAVLVGDGTSDPRNYLGYGNPNHIPPYLADVDPWIKVTACDACYAQLDGNDPLSESSFLIDIWIGRLPVADVGELHTVVDKILRYENAPDVTAPWRDISVQLADDYIESEDGSLDRAGNFWAYIENIIKLQPPLLNIARVYYNVAVDPAVLDPATRKWYETVRPWLETNQLAAQDKARRSLSAGAGLATFTGHSNHWQWARMGKVAGYDYRLFGLLDVDGLTNRDAMFIGLSMTCYTSQFTIPAPDHATLDERLLLHPNGGAVAMWGPAGLSVAHGHDALQAGFYDALWKANPLHARLGRLTQSGYNHVVLNTPCCQDVARTFLLLGDPLTPARVRALDALHLPRVSTSGTPALSAQE